MQDLGFVQSKSDTSLFIFNKSGIIIFVLIYVDDIIVTSSSESAISTLLQKLSSEYALTDLRDLHFLRTEVKRTDGGILLTQDKYALELLGRAGMKNIGEAVSL